MGKNKNYLENPGIFLGEDQNGGIVVTGPLTAQEAGNIVTQSVMNKKERVIMYKSWTGRLPILEIIMEMLYREIEK